MSTEAEQSDENKSVIADKQLFADTIADVSAIDFDQLRADAFQKKLQELFWIWHPLPSPDVVEQNLVKCLKLYPDTVNHIVSNFLPDKKHMYLTYIMAYKGKLSITQYQTLTFLLAVSQKQLHYILPKNHTQSFADEVWEGIEHTVLEIPRPHPQRDWRLEIDIYELAEREGSKNKYYTQPNYNIDYFAVIFWD